MPMTMNLFGKMTWKVKENVGKQPLKKEFF